MLNNSLTRITLRKPWFGVLMAAAILVVSIVGLLNTKMMPDLRVFFASNNPDKVELDQFETDFVREDSALIVLTAKNGDIFTPQVVSAVADTVERAWRLSYVRRVDAVTNFQYSRLENGVLRVSDLIPNPHSASDEELLMARTESLSSTELIGSLLNDQASVTAIRIVFFMPGIDPRTEAPQVLGELQTLKSHIEEKHSAVEVHLTGTVPMNATFTLAARKDLKTLFPLMVVVVLLLVGVVLQMASAIGIVLLMVVISAAASLSLLGWFNIALNIATVMSPLIVMTLSVAAATHFLSAIRRELNDARLTNSKREMRREVVQRALTRHGLPIILSLVTTIMGFLALNFSISPPFRQLGNAVACGLFVTLILTLTLLPSLVILLPFKPLKKPSRMQSWIEQLPRLMARWPTPVWGSVLLLTLGVGLSGLNSLRLEDDFIAYFDRSFEFRQDTDYIEKNLTGLRVLEYPFRAKSAGGAYATDFLTQVDAFAQWMRKQPHVASVQTPTDTLKRLVMNMNDDKPDAYRLPQSNEEAAQYMLMYEMSLGYGMDLTDRIMLDKSGVRVSVILRNLTTADTRALEARATKWIEQNAELLRAEPTGIAHVFTLLAFRDAKAMLVGTMVALVLISLGMMLVLRDWRLGIISLVLNLLPAILAFGLWGHIRGDVTLAISVVAAMTFGIVVDDTIHILAGYRRNRRNGLNRYDAIDRTLKYVGKAVVTTSLALLAGFGVMSLSGFAINSDMAFLTMLTIALALLCDLILLPLLLMVGGGNDGHSQSEQIPLRKDIPNSNELC